MRPGPTGKPLAFRPLTIVHIEQVKQPLERRGATFSVLMGCRFDRATEPPLIASWHLSEH